LHQPDWKRRLLWVIHEQAQSPKVLVVRGSEIIIVVGIY
jgi:hypothetical protein